MISPDSDICGGRYVACGDGPQIRLTAGNEMGAFVDLYITAKKTTLLPNAGWNQDSDIPMYENALFVVGDSIHVMAALPFDVLGLSCNMGDIHDGTEISFNLLRVSATSYHDYAGWLSFGSFFGAGNREFHPNITESNLLVLSDPERQGGEATPAEAGLRLPLDLARSSKKNIAVKLMNGGKRITSLGGKAYTTFSTRRDCCDMRFREGGLVNDLTMQEIAVGDTVYFVGGSSSRDVDALSSVYEADEFPELALLNVHEYSEKMGVLDGYTEQLPFLRAGVGRHRLCAISRGVEPLHLTAIYYADTHSGGCAEAFDFDCVSKAWSNTPCVIELPAAPEKIYTFAYRKLGIVCSANGKIYTADADSLSEIARGELIDAYFDGGARLNIIYSSGVRVMHGRLVLENGSYAEKETHLPTNIRAKLFEREGRLCAVAVGDAISEITVLEAGTDGFIDGYNVCCCFGSSENIKVVGDIMIARSDSGAEIAEHIDLMLRGKRGSALRWLYIAVPLAPDGDAADSLCKG